MRSLLFAILILFLTPTCFAQKVVELKKAPSTSSSKSATESVVPVVTGKNGPRLDQKQTHKIKIGVIITSRTVCRGINATTPVPLAWPEQQVEIAEEEFSPIARGVSYRPVGTSAKQMVVSIPSMPANDEGRALVTFEVTKHSMLAPQDPSALVMPNLKKLKTEVRVHMTASPYIEISNPKFRSIAKEQLKDKTGAWERVEALYDWTRENVEFKHGPLKGASQSLKDGYGDAEELVGVFIALCRVSDVPARMVWVPGHVYAEFYLEDADGFGYWFPAQVAGNREFGAITDFRPILMKGDNFQTSERPKERQRFVAEFLTGAGGKPSVKFIRDMVD